MAKYAIFRRGSDIVAIDLERARYDRMRKKIHAWGENVKSRGKFVMITLTYKDGSDWRPNHIREFMLSIRKRYKSVLIGYAWVAEVQERGAIHYHVLLRFNRSTFVPYPDKAGLWLHGWSNVVRSRGVGYIIKYVSKTSQKDFTLLPKGARCFAVWANVKEVMNKIRVAVLDPISQQLYSLGGMDAVREYNRVVSMSREPCKFMYIMRPFGFSNISGA